MLLSNPPILLSSLHIRQYDYNIILIIKEEMCLVNQVFNEKLIISENLKTSRNLEDKGVSEGVVFKLIFFVNLILIF